MNLFSSLLKGLTSMFGGANSSSATNALGSNNSLIQSLGMGKPGTYDAPAGGPSTGGMQQAQTPEAPQGINNAQLLGAAAGANGRGGKGRQEAEAASIPNIVDMSNPYTTMGSLNMFNNMQQPQNTRQWAPPPALIAAMLQRFYGGVQ